MAVELVRGSVSEMSISRGKTVAVGSVESWHNKRPIKAFQKPTTIQGNVTPSNIMSVTYKTVGTWGERASCMSQSMNKAELTESKQKRLRRAEIARAEGLFIKVFKGMASGSLILCKMLY
jgi:hypothetical protein